MNHKLTDAERAVLSHVASREGYVIANDYTAALQLVKRGYLQPKPVRYLNVPLVALSSKGRDAVAKAGAA